MNPAPHTGMGFFLNGRFFGPFSLKIPAAGFHSSSAEPGWLQNPEHPDKPYFQDLMRNIPRATV